MQDLCTMVLRCCLLFLVHLLLKGLRGNPVISYADMLPSGEIAALLYFWNPITIVACVGLSTSPIQNLFVVLALYGACKRLVPLAAFGWVMATYLSLYLAILIILPSERMQQN